MNASTLEGKTLRTAVTVPLSDALLGGAVRVPTLTGAIELTLPPGTDGGKQFRLKGKGFPLRVARAIFSCASTSPCPRATMNSRR